MNPGWDGTFYSILVWQLIYRISFFQPSVAYIKSPSWLPRLHGGSALQLIFFLVQIKTLTRYLISALVSLYLMLPSSHRPLQGIQSPGLWSNVPAVCPERGATSDWSQEARLVPAGGSAVLLLWMIGPSSLLRKESFASWRFNRHWHLPLWCCPEFLSALSLIFKFNQLS